MKNQINLADQIKSINKASKKRSNFENVRSRNFRNSSAINPSGSDLYIQTA